MRTRTAGIAAIAVALGVFALLLKHVGRDFDDAIQSVSNAMVEGNFRKALKRARAARPLAKTPDQRYALSVLEGTVCEKLERNPQAREAYRAALAAAGDHPVRRLEVYMHIAATYDEQNETAEIRAAFTEALKGNLNPDARHVVLLRLASACRNEGDCGAALEAYDEILAAEEVVPSVRLLAQKEVGDTHVEKEDYVLALEAYRLALSLPDEICSQSTALCRGTGRALIGLGRHTEARGLLLVCANSTDLLPLPRAEALSLVAHSLRTEGMLEEADRATERTERLAGETHKYTDADWPAMRGARSDCAAAALLAVGRYDRDHGHHDLALAAFTAILERGASPQYISSAYLEIAELAEATEDKLAAYNKVLETRNTPAEHVSEALLAVGGLHLDRGDEDKARETFTRILEMDDAPAEDKQKAQAYLEQME